jgi:hypothetical protein
MSQESGVAFMIFKYTRQSKEFRKRGIAENWESNSAYFTRRCDRVKCLIGGFSRLDQTSQKRASYRIFRS